jgi:transposase
MTYVRLTKKVIDLIVKAISDGCSNKAALAIAGCAESSFYFWQSKGREDIANGTQSIYAELVTRIEEAEASREKSLVKVIVDDPSWKSKAWLLERLYPDRWGSFEKRDITFRQAKHEKSAINLSILSQEEKHQLDEMLGKALAIKTDSESGRMDS